MFTFLKSIKKSLLLVSLTYIVIGVLLIIDQGESMDIVLSIFSVSLMVVGLFNMLRYLFIPIDQRYKRNDFVVGSIILSLGAYMFKELAFLTINATMILGLAMCISGFISIQDLFDAKAIGVHKSGAYSMSALICLVLGILSIINPFVPGMMIYILTGVGMLFCGITDTFSNFYLAKSRVVYEASLIEGKEEVVEVKQEEVKVEEEKVETIDDIQKIDIPEVDK